MKRIFLLTDYKGRFGSRHDDFPYRSGMDLELLRRTFNDNGYETEVIPLSGVTPGDGTWTGKAVLYTSSEDVGLIYKQYIEDVVLALACAGAKVIPGFEYLRANNNKVFMELLRGLMPEEMRGNLSAAHFATIEELEAREKTIDFPVIIKGFSGAQGRNVFLANNSRQFKQIIKRKVITGSNTKFRIKEFLRQIRHKGYRRDSFYRGRFVIQKFIPGLKNDWKVYFFGTRAYVFQRPVLPGREFRASGGGYDNYKYGAEAGAPDGMLDFAWKIFVNFNVPNASMDLAWDGHRFYLLEFQCLYFGTAGILKRYSPVYFQKHDEKWKEEENDGVIERAYAESVIWFLGKVK
ncbi:MAG: hypothetical protein IH591_07755 [Bacteroidales bacterium]|nr:hypothetical protein [Bacteroidales bacterium]